MKKKSFRANVLSQFLSRIRDSDPFVWSEEELLHAFERARASFLVPETFGEFLHILDRGWGAVSPAVSLLAGYRVFPDDPRMDRMRTSPEAGLAIIQDLLRSLGRKGHVGGFDILYDEAVTTVPPKQSVIFTLGGTEGILKINANIELKEIPDPKPYVPPKRSVLRRLTSRAGGNPELAERIAAFRALLDELPGSMTLKLNALIIPIEEIIDGAPHTSASELLQEEGIMTKDAACLPYRYSILSRAMEEARALVKSRRGQELGFASYNILLQQIEQENIEDEIGF